MFPNLYSMLNVAKRLNSKYQKFPERVEKKLKEKGWFSA